MSKATIRIRAEDHVGRLAVTLVREELAFDVTPERDGWWRIRAEIPGSDKVVAKRELQSFEQSTRTPA